MLKREIVFCGTPLFACPSLRALAQEPTLQVVQVITQPDRPSGRGQRVIPTPVKTLANELGIPVLQPEDIQELDETTFVCDYLIAVAFGQIFPPWILSRARIAPVNLHASLLPRHRGASPVQQCILSGDRETGVSVQRMIEELDAGPILSQSRIVLSGRETTDALLHTLADIGANLLVQTLREPLRETIQDTSLTTFCRKLTRDMGNGDPLILSAEEIDRSVRALTPWPGVHLKVDGEMVKVWDTSLEYSPDALPVECAMGSVLYIRRLQSPTRRILSAMEWLNGKKGGL